MPQDGNLQLTRPLPDGVKPPIVRLDQPPLAIAKIKAEIFEQLQAGGPLADGDQPVPAFIQALLEQTADSLDSLQRTMAKAEESRLNMDHSLEVLAERLGTLTDQLRSEQSILTRLAESQAQLRPVLTQLAEVNGTRVGGLDDASRDHLRNLDHHMGRLVQEAASGRNKAVEEIRSEIRLLARTIAALAEDTEAR